MSKTLRLSKVFDTDIHTLFDLWTTEEHLKRWFRPHATEFATTEAAVDLQTGGKFLIVMEGPGGRHAVGGEYTSIERPSLLAFTWQWEGGEEVTHVSLQFEATEQGTRLTLTHEHPDSSTRFDAHKEGWHGCLAVLEASVTT